MKPLIFLVLGVVGCGARPSLQYAVTAPDAGHVCHSDAGADAASSDLARPLCGGGGYYFDGEGDVICCQQPGGYCVSDAHCCPYGADNRCVAGRCCLVAPGDGGLDVVWCGAR